jgi:hypothetical protein
LDWNHDIAQDAADRVIERCSSVFRMRLSVNLCGFNCKQSFAYRGEKKAKKGCWEVIAKKALICRDL